MKLGVLGLFAAMWMTSAIVYSQSQMAGTWTGDQQGGNGAEPTTLELRINSSGVTGSVTVGQNPTERIADAQVDGSTLTFTTTPLLNGKEVPMYWAGEAKNDDLTLVRSLGTGHKLPTLVLKRAN